MVCTLSSKTLVNLSGRSSGEKVVGSGVHLFLDISLLVFSKSSFSAGTLRNLSTIMT